MKLSRFQNLQYQALCKLSDFFATWSSRNIEHLAHILARLMWIFLYSRRSYTIHAISKHLDLTIPEAKKIAKQSFKENCLSFFEITRTKNININSPNLEIINPDFLAQICSNERPIVACTAHFGSWELLSSLISKLHPGRTAQIVTRRHRNPVIQNYMERQRSIHGAEIVGHRNAVFPVIKGLKKNGIAAFLIDHKASESEAIMLPFFNALAPVNQGPALLALRSNALVFSVFLTRNTNNYTINISPPLDCSTLNGTREENIQSIANYYTNATEQIIRTNPTQWLWLHRRWGNEV